MSSVFKRGLKRAKQAEKDKKDSLFLQEAEQDSQD
eukprot:CAMPEP_0116883046 /NCGR_PEP_ID=MMETSP0463-20121206/15474_1 /TAXON_ID=181622 /ORGANISM="Strombidinopsis sp, Strain SopsisLIS2011" /LENGTH=34 /DNA_ID= /DNA_START= /DNA_END= /DNA_ORIENTATION=